MPRSYSPNKFHSRYHQMGDHPLFHNGSTAKLFPAINTLSPDRISEMYGVATVDRKAERDKEMAFHEPLTTVAANYTFREVDSPVRDQVRNKLSSRCGTANSTATGRIGSQPSSPPYHNTTTTSSRPLTSTNSMVHQQLSRPPPFISGGNPKVAREQMTSNGSIFTGFDVDEDLKQEKLRKQNESINQQMKICCLSPTIIREAGLNSSASYSSRPGTRGSSSNGGRVGGQQQRPQSQGPQSPNSMRGSPRSGRLGSSGGSRPNTAASIQEEHLLASVKSTFRPFTRGTVGSAQDSLVCKSYLNSGDNETAWSIRMLESQRVKNRR